MTECTKNSRKTQRIPRKWCEYAVKRWTSNRNLGQLYQYEKGKHARHKKRQQTRADGKFDLQPQEILALCCEKTNAASAKNAVKTKESKHFIKNLFLQAKNKLFKPSKFYSFEL